MDKTESNGPTFITTDGGFRGELVPGQDEQLLRYLTCQDCGDLYQTTITIKTRNKNRDVKFCCGNCYIKKENSLDLVSIDEDVANLTGNLKLKCPEEGSCAVKSVTLNNYDEHRDNHRIGKKQKLSDNTRAEKHMEAVEDLLAQKMETELPSTSQGRSSVQPPQTEPELDKFQVFSKIVKTMDLEAHKVLYEVFAPSQLLPSEIVDYYSTASMLAGTIKNKDCLHWFYDSLCTLKTRESKEYTDFDTFCSTLFPEYVKENLVYMNKPLNRSLSTGKDRRTRIKFFDFLSHCGLSQLQILKQVFKIDTNLSRENEKQIDNMREAIMIGIFRKNELTLNDILHKIKKQPGCDLIVERLKRKIVIDQNSFSDDIRINFDKPVSDSRKEKKMVNNIKMSLNSYQCSQLNLLLTRERRGLRNAKDFSTLYYFLHQRAVTVEELVLAMIDANLFSGDVREAIQNCYGNPVESTDDQEVNISQRELPEYMRGKINDKLVYGDSPQWEDRRRARIRILDCFYAFRRDELLDIASHFNFIDYLHLPPGEQNIPALLQRLAHQCISTDEIFSFFKGNNTGAYAHLIENLVSNEHIDLNLPLSNEHINKKMLKVSVTNGEIQNDMKCGLERSGELASQDLEMLSILLFKGNDRCEMLKRKRFVEIFNRLYSAGRTWEELLQALHDLKLKKAFHEVEKAIR